MHKARLRMVAALLAACASMLTLSIGSPAMAAPARPMPLTQSLGPLRPASIPRLGATGDLRFIGMNLPAGSRIKGKIGANTVLVFNMFVFDGSWANFQLWGSNGNKGWAMMVGAPDIDKATPITWTETGWPEKVSFRGSASTHDGYALPYAQYWVYLIPPAGGGSYSLDYWVSDPPVDHDVTRIGSSSRYGTSLLTAESAFQTTATAVVVATGEGFADALSASALCGSYDAPLLLTDPDMLLPGTEAAIDWYAPEKVFVIGDEKAVSAAVFQTLVKEGREVTRVAGIDRYATAAAVARKVQAHEIEAGRTPSKKAFVVSGTNFPDALSVSPYAFSQRMPILPVKPKEMPSATRSVIASLGVETAYVFGGTGAVGDTVMSALPIGQKMRFAGVDRTDTARLAAELAVGNGWADWKYVGVATGWNYPDALSGGVAAGKMGGVMLLSRGAPLMSDPPWYALHNHASELQKVVLYGSTSSLGAVILGDADDAWTQGLSQ